MQGILMGGAGAAGVLLVIALVWARARSRRRAQVSVTRPEPRSLFRILRTEEELGEALRRAASYELLAAEACRHRADRYEAMLRPLGCAEVSGVDEDAHPLSA